MNLKFEDLKLEKDGRSNPNPLEVTLFEGVVPNIIASSSPCAYTQDVPTTRPGITLVGYLISLDSEEIGLTYDKVTDENSRSVMGGFHAYKDAIHSIRQLP